MPNYQRKWREIAFSTNKIDLQKAIELVQFVYSNSRLGEYTLRARQCRAPTSGDIILYRI
jgi:hypothetical protein